MKFDLIFNLATLNKEITAEEWALKLREEYHAPLNHVFVIQNTQEIGYVTTGKFPLRKHNIV